MAWYLDRYAQKEADAQFSFGYRRFSLLGAFINTIVLIAGSLWIMGNAVTRLLSPEPAQAEGMILLAIEIEFGEDDCRLSLKEMVQEPGRHG